jgi:hypothetical protein
MITPSKYKYCIDGTVLGDLEIVVDYYFTPVQRGRYSGPPEDCYPDEDEEIEIVDCHCPLLSAEGRLALFKWLEDDERLIEEISEYEAEGDDDENAP